MTIAAARKSCKPAAARMLPTAVAFASPPAPLPAAFADAVKLAIIGAILLSAFALPLFAGAQDEPFRVTQKGRQFRPGALSIRRGDTIEIVNDDGELIHHAYVDSKSFSFDSGDQEPGSKTDIVFSVPGQFVVLCGIHPKMRLDVDVK